MTDPKILRYIIQCRRMKINDIDIKIRLLKSGWQEDVVDKALGNALTKFLESKEEVPKIFFEKNIDKKSYKESKKNIFLSKKILGYALISLFILIGIVSGGYLFFNRQKKSVSQSTVVENAKNQKNSKQVEECSQEDVANLPKPKNSGWSVARVDSTMALLIQAMEESDYCLLMSLMNAGVKDQYRDKIKNFMKKENTSKREKFIKDAKGYKIPAIDPESSEARVLITSAIDGNNSGTFDLKLQEEETGEYLLLQI